MKSKHSRVAGKGPAAALIEWIKDETFNGEENGSWIVGESGVVSEET